MLWRCDLALVRPQVLALSTPRSAGQLLGLGLKKLTWIHMHKVGPLLRSQISLKQSHGTTSGLQVGR